MALLTSLLAPLSLHRLRAQDHFLVCFTVSRYKCDNGCCLFAVKFLRRASRDASAVFPGRSHWVAVSRSEVSRSGVLVLLTLLARGALVLSRLTTAADLGPQQSSIETITNRPRRCSGIDRALAVLRRARPVITGRAESADICRAR